MVEYRELKPGESFVYNGSTYTKRDAEVALNRRANGRPDFFRPDTLVESVPPATAGEHHVEEHV